jgi:hypothetical protein
MKTAIYLSVCLFVATATGCGRESKTPDNPPVIANPANGKGAKQPPLPDWAPKGPSPEFLRAAKVLKPLPPEMLVGAAQGDAALEAMLARYTRSFAAAYEFFGTLSDEQIERFLSTKVIRLPVRSLTSAQRAALDNWFDAFRQAMEGGPPELADFRVILYKAGATEDLSNVDVGIRAGEGPGGGHLVDIRFWVRQPDGSFSDDSSTFAQI